MNGECAKAAGRSGHAVLDLPSRSHKAAKIATLLGADVAGPSRRMLEVGAGSGGIAHYFGTSGPMGWDVTALDVEDVRRVADGYDFLLVGDAVLPFPDGTFDVVVSNHVIEHVGDEAEQARHLSELRRVMRPDGIGYLAVPSRWMPVEPHFRLPLLSWLPRSLADRYVRLAGRGDHYDCRPLTVGQLEQWLAATGFDFEQQHGRALRLTYELERPRSVLYRWLLRRVPDAAYAMVRRAFPTLIYVLWPRASGAPPRDVPPR